MAAPATPAGLSVQPTPGGLKVGCSVTATATTYQFRHSTDEAAWTTRTAISDNFETIPSLLYTTTYFVQVRASNGDGDSAWSASVQGQPWIDVDAEWSPVHHVTAVHEPTNHGDLGGTYETNDWAVAVAVDFIKTGVVQTLFGWQAQIASTPGRAGMFARVDAGNELDCLTVVGSNSLETASAASYISAAGRKVLMVRKVGTALRIYDEDGTQIGTATLSSATMDWTTSGSLRTSTLGHWNSETASLDSQMYGGVKELVGIPATVTDAERDAVLRWLREYWLEREDETRVDLFADAVDVDNDTTSGPSAVALSKQGLVLNVASPSPYEELRYVSVIKIADDDWAVLAGVREHDGTYTLSAVAKFTSSDGLSWAAPNLGLVTYDGNTNNALILDTASTDTVQNVIYNPDAPAGEEFRWLFENVNADPGLHIYKSADLASTPTSVKDAASGLGLDSFAEGKCLIERDDGKFQIFFVYGFGTNDRKIGHVISISDDPAGEWAVVEDPIPEFDSASSTTQFYTIRVQQIAPDYWLGYVARYNSTTEVGPLDLWVSRDKGANWTQAAAAWLPNGAGGTYDDSLIWGDTLVKVGDVWRFYYAASTTLHDTTPKPDFGLAYATVGYRRLFSIATTGTVRSTPILTGSDTAVSVNADGSGGNVTVAVLDAADNSTIAGYGGTVSTDSYGSVFVLPPHREVKLAFTLASGAVLYSYEVGALADLQTGATLTVGSCRHGHTADETALTQANVLDVGDSLHAHTVDALSLILAALDVAGSLHAHIADATALTQANVLDVADSLHGHLADGITLGVAIILAVEDSLHSHLAEAPSPFLTFALSVGDSVHGHTSGSTKLLQNALVVQSSRHAHRADTIVLVFTTEGVLVLNGIAVDVTAWAETYRDADHQRRGGDFRMHSSVHQQVGMDEAAAKKFQARFTLEEMEVEVAQAFIVTHLLKPFLAVGGELPGRQYLCVITEPPSITVQPGDGHYEIITVAVEQVEAYEVLG